MTGTGRLPFADGSPMNLAKACRVAEWAHAGQYDQGGEPYFLHALGVSRLLAPHDEETQIAGVLHDVIEDTPLTAADLRAMGASESVVETVLAVTRGAGETYLNFVRRSARHPRGRLVKLADNRHNSNPERLARLDPAVATSLSERYRRARLILEGAEP